MLLLRQFKVSISGGLTPPEGFAFVVDDNGKYIVDSSGNYIVTEI